ncbi:DUF3619 family protein [Janthinobacterium psychrotolerans]|uniref:DUF3619 family protein n=1 Tax=Janthinobacterium psychrotolerans TaxID=1747903 RepID=A0A1A7BTJ8_9BURK|nr:DUF3619 family protein [Janthinobacterium psychrotolerans]OBV36866.1 Protein of unknown function (DUF3619) [Janthinobacterium psychrotolerans]
MNTDDLNFAYKVRHALNEKLDELPASTTDRLAAARKAAMARKKADAPARVSARQNVLAGIGTHLFAEPLSWLGRMSVMVPLLVLVLGGVGIYQFEQEQQVAELAELDAAVLSDELPLSAYMDHGFNAYLTKSAQ